MPEIQSVNIEIKNGSIKCDGMARYIVERNGQFSWYVAGFDMYFSSKTHEEGMEIARAMTKSFFIYWLEKEKNFNSLILEITKMGFKAIDHRNTVNKLLRGKTRRAKFESKRKLENDFENAEVAKLEMELV